MKNPPYDRFIRMYGPILDALREAGGEASTSEISRKVADQVLGGTEERDRILKSGGNAAENEVQWARNNLKEAGLIDGSTRGIWRLTEEGWRTKLDIDSARELGWYANIKARNAQISVEEPQDATVAEEQELITKPGLLETIKLLPPKGFERLCKRILHVHGFTDVVVTGSSGDGGIDGLGVLRVNELVSMRVLFQCKRYQGSVSSKEIRDFRGAMSGRTDKGIFLTTGTFTSEAVKEAFRDGVPPIELVSGDRLVELMEKHQLGVIPRTVYDVDDKFFEPFQSES